MLHFEFTDRNNVKQEQDSSLFAIPAEMIITEKYKIFEDAFFAFLFSGCGESMPFTETPCLYVLFQRPEMIRIMFLHSISSFEPIDAF